MSRESNSRDRRVIDAEFLGPSGGPRGRTRQDARHPAMSCVASPPPGRSGAGRRRRHLGADRLRGHGGGEPNGHGWQRDHHRHRRHHHHNRHRWHHHRQRRLGNRRHVRAVPPYPAPRRPVFGPRWSLASRRHSGLVACEGKGGRTQGAGGSGPGPPARGAAPARAPPEPPAPPARQRGQPPARAGSHARADHAGRVRHLSFRAAASRAPRRSRSCRRCSTGTRSAIC